LCFHLCVNVLCVSPYNTYNIIIYDYIHIFITFAKSDFTEDFSGKDRGKLTFHSGGTAIHNGTEYFMASNGFGDQEIFTVVKVVITNLKCRVDIHGTAKIRILRLCKVLF